MIPRPRSATLARLLRRFRPHRGALALAVFLMALQAAVPGALVFLIQRVLDDVLIRQDHQMLMAMPFALVGLYAVGGALTVGRGMLTRRIAWDVITTLRSDLFAQYLKLDASWHQNHPTGGLIARLTNDVTNIQYGVSGIVTVIQKPLTLLVLLGSALWMNPVLTLVAIAALPLVAWPIARFGNKLRGSVRSSQDNLAELSATAGETLSGIQVVQAFGGEQERTARFEAANETQRRLQLTAFMAQLSPGPIVELIAAMGVGLVLWLGGQQVFSGEIAPGELIAFMVALGLLNDPLKGIAQVHSLTQRAIAGAEAVFTVLDTPASVPDHGTLDAPHHPVPLRFERVDFDYGDGPVLQSVDFEIPMGSVVALVGASGGGKSTIASLISRFRDPTGGSIRLGDTDLRDLRLSSLRRSVAIVGQDPFLFNDTVRANIAFGTEASESAIQEAARVANAHDFIMDLPAGYDTSLTELGMRLSGGQRQRICIARAVLRDAPILVLDEATSALDAESEAQVQEALERLMQDRTVLSIAHRLSTVRNADRILVLEHGRIIEHGDHDTLVKAGGIYARLLERQIAH